MKIKYQFLTLTTGLLFLSSAFANKEMPLNIAGTYQQVEECLCLEGPQQEKCKDAPLAISSIYSSFLSPTMNNGSAQTADLVNGVYVPMRIYRNGESGVDFKVRQTDRLVYKISEMTKSKGFNIQIVNETKKQLPLKIELTLPTSNKSTVRLNEDSLEAQLIQQGHDGIGTAGPGHNFGGPTSTLNYFRIQKISDASLIVTSMYRHEAGQVSSLQLSCLLQLKK